MTRFVDAMVRQDATEVKVQASKRRALVQAAMRVAMACGDDGSCDAAVKRDTAVTVARILRGGSFADAPSMRLLDARIVSPPAIRDQVAGFRVLRE